MITLEMYLMGRDKTHDCPEEVKRNAAELLEKVNRLLAMMDVIQGIPPLQIVVSSGWRPAEVNARVSGAAKRSHHITGNAIDIHDPVGLLKDWICNRLIPLDDCDLYMEHPSATPTWLHLQQIPPKSGKRVFYP